MPRHLEKKIMPYTSEQLFDLVADVANYPAFLPWCHKAKVYDQTDVAMKADLLVGYKAIRDTFSSVVTLNRPHTIAVSYEKGPLAHLENQWTFASTPDGQCEVTFYVDFRFRSLLLGAMMDVFFDHAFLKMVQAFETRAGQVYGKG